MKQSDIITIVLITMIGTIAAGFAVNAILGNPDEASESWKTIKVVESSLVAPNPDTFNADAINPTVEVYVGNCVDLDGDNELSYEEQIACGWRSSGSRVIVNSQTEEESSSSSSNSSSDSSPSSSNESSSSSTAPITVEEILRQRELQQQSESSSSSSSSSSSNSSSNSSSSSSSSSSNETEPSVTPTVPSVTPTTESTESSEAGDVDVPNVEL